VEQRDQIIGKVSHQPAGLVPLSSCPRSSVLHYPSRYWHGWPVALPVEIAAAHGVGIGEAHVDPLEETIGRIVVDILMSLDGFATAPGADL